MITKKCSIKGITPIMFDRYPGDNKTVLPPQEKMYFEKNTKKLIIPSVNIMSFLCAENTKSAVKTFYDPRKYKRVAQAILGFVVIEPFEIPLMRNDKQLEFEEFDKNGIWLHKSVARLEKGVPNPKERPVIDQPWELFFTLKLFPNDEISETEIKLLFERGGFSIGLGTYRGMFGKFEFSWE